ncbi:MAG: SGNH/GDSL hydrolase family protein [Mangrovicoccus sp.]|nr:SGNH/GDSL hydrolase family protein [Mangrovicoccus sp.]
MTVLRFLVLCLGVLGFVPAAGASTLSDEYSSFFVFGDSLSDNGNVASNLGFPTEIAGRPFGRATNGLVWNEPILAEFESAGKTAENYAHAAAKAIGFRDARLGELGIVDLRNQVTRFIAATTPAQIGDRGLAAIWIGGNDLRGLGGAIDPSSPLTPQQQAALYLGRVVKNVGDAIAGIAGAGINDFLIFNLPDIGRIPEFAGLPAVIRNQLSAATIAFNQALEVGLARLPVNSTVVDVYSLSVLVDETLAAGGSIFGVDTLGPCVGPNATTNDCTTSAFWDQIHPTQALHDEIESQARAALAVAAVPLPAAGWMMIVVLGGLGGASVLSRRRAR